jgi:hypothetical protein
MNTNSHIFPIFLPYIACVNILFSMPSSLMWHSLNGLIRICKSCLDQYIFRLYCFSNMYIRCKHKKIFPLYLQYSNNQFVYAILWVGEGNTLENEKIYLLYHYWFIQQICFFKRRQCNNKSSFKYLCAFRQSQSALARKVLVKF